MADNIHGDSGFDKLAPWDANAYFQLPKETTFVGAGAGSDKLLVEANPNRVALIIGSALGGKVNLSTSPLVGTATGLTTSLGQVPIQLTHHDVGPLVQSEWHFWNVAGVNVTVIEIILTRWP